MLAERHREEREAFLASGKAQFRETRQAGCRMVRDEFKPLWRARFDACQRAAALADALAAAKAIGGEEEARGR